MHRAPRTAISGQDFLLACDPQQCKVIRADGHTQCQCGMMIGAAEFMALGVLQHPILWLMQ